MASQRSSPRTGNAPHGTELASRLPCGDATRPGDAVVDDLGREELQRCVDLRKVDVLAAAGVSPVDEGGSGARAIARDNGVGV